MTIHLERRSFIRFLTFLSAAVLVLSLTAYRAGSDSDQQARMIENQYLKSMNDLTTHAQTIDSNLTKIQYANTPSMLATLTSHLWREASLAKTALANLPIGYLELQNTNKFLSQVGDYCVSLSKGFSGGTKITQEQRDNLKKLGEYSDTMLLEVLAANDGIQTGSIDLRSVVAGVRQDMGEDAAPIQLVDGFADFEAGLTEYPTLIYDGPFSDHIMQKEAEHLKGTQNVSRSQAKEQAAKAAGLSASALLDSHDEESKMPSYGFRTEDLDISVTKMGGFVSYMTRYRDIADRKLSIEECIRRAGVFLDKMEVGTVKYTYYEIAYNVLTINYAAVQNDVLLYTDLIKVSVAMDTGDICGYDARGYLVNNHRRALPAPLLSAEQAAASVSSSLYIQKNQLTLIPSVGLNEILCYEFKCKADNKDILVYINTQTGMEEQILILLIDDNGQLTI